ncbi:MAG: guanylate kinase [Deltaproteobacteria bacterium]|nr:MAG: guanylate kinase [Deltaproteobacteria bacterium]
MEKKGHLFIISGPSGAGKSTVVDLILKKRPQLEYSISYTTRPPRGDERDGVDYHFITEASFREKIERGEFAEWAKVYGCLYGTSAAYIEEALASGRDVVLDIDVQGAEKLYAKYPDAVLIFLVPPSFEKLQKRLVKRGTDSSETIKSRLRSAEAEMSAARHYHYVIVNDDLGKTVSELNTIIEKVHAHE